MPMGSSRTAVIGRQKRQDESEAEFVKNESWRKIASDDIKMSQIKTGIISKFDDPTLKYDVDVKGEEDAHELEAASKMQSEPFSFIAAQLQVDETEGTSDRAAPLELKVQMEYSNLDEADDVKSQELQEISRRDEKEAIEAKLLQEEAIREESEAKARIQQEEEVRLAQLQADADSKFVVSFPNFRFKQMINYLLYDVT
jgi:hypothetical protein